METAIAAHRAAVEGIAAGGKDDFDAVILAAERADFLLSRVWSPVGHLASVADTPELREAHAAAQALMTAYLMEAGQNRAHHDAVARLAARPAFASCSEEHTSEPQSLMPTPYAIS